MDILSISDNISKKIKKNRTVNNPEILCLLDKLYSSYNNKNNIISYFDSNTNKFLRKHYSNSDFVKNIKYDAIDKLELLVDWYNSFNKIYQCIENAKESIYIQMFLWRYDKEWINLFNKLIEAAYRWVKIIINKEIVWKFFNEYDILPSKEILQIKNELKNNKNITLNESISRDHSKYFIFDEKKLIIGWMNIWSFSYIHHDYMVYIEWHELINNFYENIITWINKHYNHLPISFYWNIYKNGIYKKNIKNKYIELINKSKKNITIEMIYIWDTDIINELRKATKRGIKINIIISRDTDWGKNLNFKSAKQLKEKCNEKVKIYLFKKSLHWKLCFIDDTLTFLWSSNLDMLSTSHNQESNVLINDIDCKFTKDIKKQLYKDMSHNSILIDNPKQITYSNILSLLYM